MIELNNIVKVFNGIEVIKSVSLKINEGDRLVIIGPSGSGKSTFLRSINLLESIDSGDILFEGKNIKELDINKYREKVGMVFQSFNLFSHLTILDNLILTPVTKKIMSKEAAIEKAKILLNKIGLNDKINEYPSQLSGGQKQRIAIIRAMMMNPKVILFDEPTSALDPEMVGEVLDLIASLVKENITMVLVTHEMDFAKKAANRVVFMDKGVIVEDSHDPVSFFENQTNERIKKFLG